MAVTINGTTGIETNADTGKVKVGADDDLLIQHDGNNSTIDNSTGDLLIRQLGSSGDIYLDPKSGERGVKVIRDGAVELYYNNSKKIETSNGGVIVTGSVEASGNLSLADDGKAKFGAGDDLQIYHDGNNSLINASGTGDLIVQGADDIFIRPQDGEDGIKVIGNGSVELYYDNTKVLETYTTGITITGPEGGNGEIYLYADEGDDNADKWRLQSNTNGYFYLSNFGDSASWETNILAKAGAEVQLYHNNDKQFATDSAGCDIYDHDSTVQLKFHTTGTTVCGYVYGSGDSEFGFLDKNGSWRLRTTDSGYQLYGTNHSDRDLKENITTVSGSSLDKLNKLTAKSYTWKQNEDGRIDTSQTYVGFIAQEVQPHFPELVTGTDGNKDMGIDYSGLYAHAIKAIQELSAEVETLKTKVAALEAA